MAMYKHSNVLKLWYDYYFVFVSGKKSPEAYTKSSRVGENILYSNKRSKCPDVRCLKVLKLKEIEKIRKVLQSSLVKHENEHSGKAWVHKAGQI